MAVLLPPVAPLIPPAERTEDPAALYMAGLESPTSRVRQARAINEVTRLALGLPGKGKLRADAKAVPWRELEPRAVLELVGRIRARWAHPTSARHHVVTLRCLLKAAGASLAALAAARPPKGSRLPAGRALTPDEIRALERVASANPRDHALVILLAHGAFRVSEVVNADAADWDGSGLTVIGKGDKQRRIPFEPTHAQIVRGYLAGRTTGPLLTGWKGAAQGRRMGVRGVQALLLTLAKRAQIAPFSPHDFRRGALTAASAAGLPVQYIQHFAGHASISSTTIYLRTDPAETNREVSRRLHEYRATRPATSAATRELAPGAPPG